MKKHFKVSFKYSESVFCSNIAIAESAEDVEKYYSQKYAWVAVSEASPADVRSAEQKGMPFVDVPQQERVGTLARDIVEFFDDVDPYGNTMSDVEMMESIVNLLIDCPSSIIDDLQEIIDDDEDYRETGEKLKARINFFASC